MKKRVLIASAFLVFILAFSSVTWALEARVYDEIPEKIVKEMRQHSWREGCPVAIGDLVYLQVPYLGYDGRVRMGELIVHEDVAEEVVAIFGQLLAKRFPINGMKLINEYAGDDDASMRDNNTSAFNCRSVPGHPGVFSRHSHGKAIDINPLVNPFVKGGEVLPEEGRAYLDRKAGHKGMIVRDDVVQEIFEKHGWTWGGDWKTLKDYQHFQK